MIDPIDTTSDKTQHNGKTLVWNPRHFTEPLRTPLSPQETEFTQDSRSPLTTASFLSDVQLSSGYTTKSELSYLRTARNTRPFRSRVITQPSEKEWLHEKPSRQDRIAIWIPRIGLLVSVCILAGFIYGGWTAWETNRYCLVMEDNFDAFDSTIWTREIELGGYGNGEFEWTTPYDENAYVKDGKLYMVPTVADWPQAEQTTLNLTELGICTVDTQHSGRTIEDSCWATRNQTKGTYIPPIRSSRISTRNSMAIKYGRVEVTAKMPVGDWIWPAIWMLPTENTYGLWPQSGEMDIAESRGNAPGFMSVDSLGALSAGGHDTVVSTLHWGTNTPYVVDQSSLTTNGLTFPSGPSSLTSDFHTFGMEWTANSIRTYVDKKLTRVAYFKLPAKGFWQLGKFSTISLDQGYTFTNPWIAAAQDAPFDQEFYLIINLAVGGLGYFNTIDGLLPWNVNDGRDLAMEQFMNAQASWNATWGSPEERGLVISSVKMWKLCN